MRDQEIKVPDIGDFQNVPVVEILVAPGSSIAINDPLIALESDKATMEIPSTFAGTVKELKVSVGDTVSKGHVILVVEVAEGGAQVAASREAPKPEASLAPQSAPAAARYAGGADMEAQVVVLGAGPGGYSAAFRAADLGLKTILVERYPTLGGVCLNVGCIPSKALLHVAAVMKEAAAISSHGISYQQPKIDLDALRSHKGKVVGKLTSGLAGMAKARQVEVVQGMGRFVDPHHLCVELAEGLGPRIIRFDNAIIAAGSEAVRLPFIPNDHRIIDSTGALELRRIPKRMLVIGGGIIGLEMATIYAALGSRIDVVEMLDGLMPGTDRDLVKVWQKHNEPLFNDIMLKTKTTAVEAKTDAVYVTFEGAHAPKEPQPYDMVLVAVGRSPNGRKIDAEKAGVAVTERGFIETDKQMRTNQKHIFAIGDIVGQPMLAHKAVHEGHVAAEVASGLTSHFDAQQIPCVAYTDPEVAWAGYTEADCQAKGIGYAKATFPWAASGRAIANGREEGFTKLLFDTETQHCIGGGIVGTHAGDLIGEVCLAIEMGADVTDIAKTIHPHPTLTESIGMAAEVFKGVCMDLPPLRKR